MTLKTAKPVRGYLLVEPASKEKQTESGIFIPEVVKDRPEEGVVLKVGEDLLTEYGAIISSPVKVGDNVVFKKWGGNEVKIDNKEYFFIRFDDIIGVC